VSVLRKFDESGAIELGIVAGINRMPFGWFRLSMSLISRRLRTTTDQARTQYIISQPIL